MVKLKNPLLSLNAHNTLGKAITFVRRRSQNIAEEKPEPFDAQTALQLSWRHMFLKAVALWNALSAAEKEDWESLARSRHMTGYAWFISQALKPNPGLYLPLQGGTMTGDITMGKNRILQLPLPVDSQEAITLAYHDVAANLPTHGEAQHTDIARELFIPGSEGWTDGVVNASFSYAVVTLADDAGLLVKVTTKVPDNFVSFTSLKAVWSCASAAGNMWWKFRCHHAAAGELFTTHVDAPVAAATATGGVNILNVQEPANPLTLVNLALGDYMGLEFYRSGAHASDTLNAAVLFYGFLFTYIANQ